MPESYEDYEREYNAYLSRIRSFLAGARSRSTSTECERLLSEAKQCATAMQGLAEVEGNPMKIKEAQQRIQRDITPLMNEVQRAANEAGREELFYNNNNQEHNRDMESLIQNSDDLLRESQALCLETEQIGNYTLHQMGAQREQLEGANRNIETTRDIAAQAGTILRSMGMRAMRNKMCLYAMIGFLILANGWALLRLWRK